MLLSEEQRTDLFSGYRQLFWGVLLMVFHVSLGPVRLLPDFVCFLMICSGIGRLRSAADCRALRRARSVSALLALVSALELGVTFVGSAALFGGEYALPLPLDIFWQGTRAVLWMLMFCDVFSAAAVLLEKTEDSAAAAQTAGRIRPFLSWHFLLTAAFLLSRVFSAEPLVQIGVGICLLPLHLWLAHTMNALKRWYAPGREPRSLPADAEADGAVV